VLLVFVLFSGYSITGYSTSGYLWIAVMALLPQLVGHSSFNYALRYVSATYVSIITQIEPIGSAIAAMILFRETPLPMQVVGSITILFGVTLASWGQSQKSQPVTPDQLEE
jgi:drug/metabolite transporter (DMT)-like permease